MQKLLLKTLLFNIKNIFLMLIIIQNNMSFAVPCPLRTEVIKYLTTGVSITKTPLYTKLMNLTPTIKPFLIQHRRRPSPVDPVRGRR